ncbi:MAG: energy-coupling factor transport system permease protein [Mycobacteriales bacterium]
MGLPASFVVPRGLHPGAWWLWALGLATAASRTRNPVLLLIIAAVAGCVVAARRTEAPWARAYATFLKLGLVVIAIRVVLQSLFGLPLPGHVVLTLPAVDLPSWAAGVRIGGPVTREEITAAAYDGLRLATLLCCLGAANALANPFRLLRCLPGALYEAGVAVVVAMSFAPQAVTAVSRVRAARRLRGRPDRGIRALRGLAMPVLEGALERSVALAASMDSRGYGRSAGLPARTRRLTAALVLGGLLGVCAGTYGLLDASASGLLGLPLLAAGAALAVAGLTLGGRRVSRTRYRPDPWAGPEWLTVACGLVVATAFVVAGARSPAALAPAVAPLVVPPLPPLAAAGALLAVLPAWLTPSPAAARAAVHTGQSAVREPA